MRVVYLIRTNRVIIPYNKTLYVRTQFFAPPRCSFPGQNDVTPSLIHRESLRRPKFPLRETANEVHYWAYSWKWVILKKGEGPLDFWPLTSRKLFTRVFFVVYVFFSLLMSPEDYPAGLLKDGKSHFERPGLLNECLYSHERRLSSSTLLEAKS